MEGIRPLSRLEKNVSGIHVSVCRDVANLQRYQVGKSTVVMKTQRGPNEVYLLVRRSLIKITKEFIQVMPLSTKAKDIPKHENQLPNFQRMSM